MSGGRFRIEEVAPLTPEVAWARLWDLQRHSEVIPLTRVSADAPATALAHGVEFCGRTGLGPLGFDDRMRVAEWSPPTHGVPGRAVVEKTGRILGGRIEVEVVAEGSDSRVVWQQQLVLPWLPSPLRVVEKVAALLAAPGYRRVIRRLLTDHA